MADIVLKNRTGTDVTYEGVQEIELNKSGSGTQKFQAGELATKTVAADFENGDQVISASSGELLTSVTVEAPDGLIPGNVREGVEIAGITGTMTAGAGWETAPIEDAYAYLNGTLSTISTSMTSIINLNLPYSSTVNIYFPNATTIVGLSNCQIGDFNFCNNVSSISWSAMMNCRFMNGGVLSFPKLNTIGDPGNNTNFWSSCFYSCTLTEFHAPNLLRIYGSYQFMNCTELSIFDAPQLRYISDNAPGLFSNCYKLATVNMPLLSSTVGSMFANNYSLSTFSIENLKTLAGGTFYNCSNLISVYLSNVTSITGSGCFYNCKKLTAINLPSLSFMRYGSYDFYNCYQLSEVNMPNLSFSYCSGYYMFASCSALTSIYLPKISCIGNYMFWSCRNLSIASFDNASLIGGYAFTNCYSLTSLYLLSNSITVLSGAAQYIFNNTPILNSSYTGAFGSIYVLPSLVSDYQVASGWSAIADRIVGYEEE